MGGDSVPAGYADERGEAVWGVGRGAEGGGVECGRRTGSGGSGAGLGEG